MLTSTSALLFALTALDCAFAGPIARSNLLKRATFDNKANAASILQRATLLPAGQYTFQAVTSGQWMVYQNSNGLSQSFYPSASATYGSPMSLEANSDGSYPQSTRISPAASNQKCVSAQWNTTWDGGSDWAGVLYSCAVGSGKLVKGLVPAKQWWYLLSASGLPQGGSPYYVIAVDHSLDMHTRGFTDCWQATGGPPANAQSVCNEFLTTSSDGQIWDIQPYGLTSTSTTSVLTTTAKSTSTTSQKTTTTQRATTTQKPTSSPQKSSTTSTPALSPLLPALPTLPPINGGKVPRSSDDEDVVEAFFNAEESELKFSHLQGWPTVLDAEAEPNSISEEALADTGDSIPAVETEDT